MMNKYSDNAREMCRWCEATKRGAGFLRVTVEFQMELRLEGQATAGFESCWEVKWKRPEGTAADSKS